MYKKATILKQFTNSEPYPSFIPVDAAGAQKMFPLKFEN